MKAREARFLDFLGAKNQLQVPIYQRTYSWREQECRQLWNDIIAAGSNDNVTEHFIGSVVYVEADQPQVTNRSPLLVIDGQQRLTTITLILTALADVVQHDEPVDGFSARKIRHRYLVDPLEEGTRRHRLILSKRDKGTLTALVGGEPEPDNASTSIIQNYRLLYHLVVGEQAGLTTLCRGLEKLSIVDVTLTRGQDNPQIIFESMNSKGLELSQTDLIRNYVLMGLEPERQEHLYEVYWYPMEQMFRDAGALGQLDSFIRDYLTLKTTQIPKKRDVYGAFKRYRVSEDIADQAVDDLVADIHQFAGYYRAMVLGGEEAPILKRVFDDLAGLEVDVAYPFLLQVYHDYRSELLTRDEFAEVVRLVESYIFRRTVGQPATSAHNKTFAAFANALRKANYLASIKAHFLNMTHGNRFPNDEEFERDIQLYGFYKRPVQKYWLDRFENVDRKERVDVDEFTIEHIIPQKSELPFVWQQDLGENWQEIHDTYLHRMGNLTLTGYNSAYSDRPFAEKRDMENGFKDSPIKLNRFLARLELFDEGALMKRSAALARQATKIWPVPEIPAEELMEFMGYHASGSGYQIEDHPKLLSGSSRELYLSLRSRIMALDEDIHEVFLKRYVAFKYSTNFVDIAPKIGCLNLTLNMKFDELDDPQHMCRDVSRLGKWGNGEVGIEFSSHDEIDYVVGLIRQSLSKQRDAANDPF